jgi:hypothetical protein
MYLSSLTPHPPPSPVPPLPHRSEGEEGYTHDLLLSKLHSSFLQIPAHFDPDYSYREAESAYLFDKLDITPVFKRWTRERSPPELFNHGFENMESMGAVYSRLSSHVFGDWNTCGKVGYIYYMYGDRVDHTRKSRHMGEHLSLTWDRVIDDLPGEGKKRGDSPVRLRTMSELISCPRFSSALYYR